MDSRTPFLWGGATAAHQVEGNNKKNDWWDFEQKGKVPFPSGEACDHYNRYEHDFDLAAELGHTAHRLSIEWSRIEPEEGQWNPRALKHYEKVLLALRCRGMEPVVTLHHFTNPQWFAERGGWEASDASQLFERFVERVVAALGQHIRFWITINEPMVFLYHGYCTGLWPPGVQCVRRALTAFGQLAKGHANAYRVIHAISEKNGWSGVQVSIAKHNGWFQPCRPNNWHDRLLTRLRDWIFNHFFTRVVVNGFLFIPGFYCEIISSRPTLDFIGLNYYTRHYVTAQAGDKTPTPLGENCELKHHSDQSNEYNVMGWEVYPEGLYRVLMGLKRYGLPVIICENGICAAEDDQRQRYIRSHFEAMLKALREGVDVRGFFYWSLLDNFEWAEGYAPRFGMIEMDYKTQERKIRESAHVFSELCRNFIQNIFPYNS